MEVDAFSYWTGSSIELTVKKGDGWSYAIKATTEEAMAALCETSQRIRAIREEAEREYRSNSLQPDSTDPDLIDPDPRSASVNVAAAITEEDFELLMQLKDRRIPGLVFAS